MRAADYRHDQAFVIEVDGDPEMHVAVHGQLAVADRRVHVRELHDGVDDCARDEGEERELVRPPCLVHALEVDLHRDERVGSDLQRAKQVGAGLELYPVELDDLVRRRAGRA